MVDLNGDGRNDLAIGERSAPFTPGGGSRVSAYLGPFSFPFERDLLSDAPSFVIELVDAAGKLHIDTVDLDQDGYLDLLVGSERNTLPPVSNLAGMVAIFRGRASWPPRLALSDADWIFHGAAPGDGLKASACGDLDGDGVPDLVLFASYSDGPFSGRAASGEAYLFLGPPSNWGKRIIDLAVDAPASRIAGADANDGLASAPPYAIADLLGDQIPDLVLHTDGDGPDNLRAGAGEIVVLRGRPIWPAVVDLRVPGAADLIVYGDAPGSALSAATVADWDGDGVADLIAGAPGYEVQTSGSSDTGAVFVLRGQNLPSTIDLAVTTVDAMVVGPATDSGLGFRVRTADFDGDGFPDLVADAHWDATPFARPHAGALFIIRGCGGITAYRDLAIEPADLSIYGADGMSFTNLNGDLLGEAFDAGDVDGDGREDLLVGAPGSEGIANSRGDDAGETHLFLGQPLGTSACVVNAEAGSAAAICAGQSYRLDGSASTVSGCTQVPQYRWVMAGQIVRDWSMDAAMQIAPLATTEYRLEVRCGECSGPCFGADSVRLTVDPDAVPEGLGNTLRAVHVGPVVRLSWEPLPLARSYSVYRSLVPAPWPAVPERSLLSAPGDDFLDVAAPPTAYFYRAVAASCSGREGP